MPNLNQATPQKLAYSISETAQALGISERTIYAQLSKNLFPIKPRRIGERVLFPVKEIEKWLDGESQPARRGRPRLEGGKHEHS